MALPFPPPTALLSSPSFVMARPTSADVESMSNIYYDSFQTDPGNTYWWSRDRASQVAWLNRRVEGRLRDPSMRHFKIIDVDAGNEIVAWARWAVPQGSSKAFGEGADAVGEERGPDSVAEEETGPTTAAADADADAEPPTASAGAPAAAAVDYPEGADPATCQGFFDAMESISKKWDASNLLSLGLLCTSPKYFRRGAGRALLVPMLELADAEGLKTYLEATAAGKPLYEKLGFRQVDTLILEDSKLMPDRDTPVGISVMIREPKTSKS